MWKDLSIENVKEISKLTAVFELVMIPIHPSISMSIKVYEKKDNSFLGISDTRLRKPSSNTFFDITSTGRSVEEVLEKIVMNFNTGAKNLYPEEYGKKEWLGLTEFDAERIERF